jgi:hypothetical protein
VARHANLRVGEEESLMIETLAGVSPSKFEDLREDPSLAEAAVVGVKGSGVPEDPTDLAEPSAEERARSRESWSARPAPAGWR